MSYIKRKQSWIEAFKYWLILKIVRGRPFTLIACLDTSDATAKHRAYMSNMCPVCTLEYLQNIVDTEHGYKFHSNDAYCWASNE